MSKLAAWEVIAMRPLLYSCVVACCRGRRHGVHSEHAVTYVHARMRTCTQMQEHAASEAGLRAGLQAATRRVEELMSECEGLRGQMGAQAAVSEAAVAGVKQQMTKQLDQVSC